MRRHVHKPGITGWAQVHGLRGDTSIEERITYDLFYLENWSLGLDIKIILKTLATRENAY
jgi:lipopolysaccharide/colanic/teichoic acid biosynthesis glycosyltransferase